MDLDRSLAGCTWDTRLFTPHSMVSQDEHNRILEIIPEHVDALYQCQAIVNPAELLHCLTKPLRPCWITQGMKECLEPMITENVGDYLWIVCVNPSAYIFRNGKRVVEKKENSAYYYTPGAADDEESWARNMSPTLFWKHFDAFASSKSIDDDDMDTLIDNIVGESKLGDLLSSDPRISMHRIGQLPIWIGSRRAGRPPDCWENFDAILNVTDQEYDNILPIKADNKQKYYLQLPVAEGKRDRTELERWMPVGLLFLMTHVQKGNNFRILVHCNQGKDRSVAMVLAFVTLCCSPKFPLSLDESFFEWDISTFIEKNDQQSPYCSSGLCKKKVEKLLGKDGKHDFRRWIHTQKYSHHSNPLADKDRIRISLHLIRQDRTEADPSRSTMQKINRFFMSDLMHHKR